MITADMVIDAVKGYMESYDYEGAEAKWSKAW
jgi:hypothetical protein